VFLSYHVIILYRHRTTIHVDNRIETPRGVTVTLISMRS